MKIKNINTRDSKKEKAVNKAIEFDGYLQSLPTEIAEEILGDQEKYWEAVRNFSGEKHVCK